jgi:hypothetical protein
MITLTKAQALAIQAMHIAHYAPLCPDLAAKVAAITKADQLKDDVEYDIITINRHIPRGSAIEHLCGVDLGGE